MQQILRRVLRRPNPLDELAAMIEAADQANAIKDWSKAMAAYASALERDPTRVHVRIQYAHVLKEQGLFDQAEREYRRALVEDAGDAETWSHLGHLLLHRNRGEEACLAFRRARANQPDSEHLSQVLAALGDTELPGRDPPKAFLDMDELGGPEPSRDANWPDDRRGRLIGLVKGLSPSRAQQGIAFIHLQKTGGSTLDDMLQHFFRPDLVCPIHDNNLHLLSREQIAEFDYFAGHFDYAALRLIPKKPIRLISVFREPQARLVSLYRSHLGHPVAGDYKVNRFVQLANSLSPEEFFENEEVRRAPEVFNHYLCAFGLSYRQVELSRTVGPDQVVQSVIDKAIGRVRNLDVIGILERFEETLSIGCATLGFPKPPKVKRRNVTDALATRMKGAPPPKVEITPRLVAALDDLIRYDRLIYAAAVDEFEKRLGSTGVVSRAG